jgi:hypothetical protein
MSDAREARLPKWAQDELIRLRAKVVSVEAYAAELRESRGESDTYVQNYLHGDYALPVGARIAFHMSPDDGRIRRSVKVHMEDGALHLQGDDMLTLLPEASNSIRVKFGRRW